MSQKILVVDDDEYIRELYEEIFLDAGFAVDTAVDGQDGLEKITKTKYDLVLLDIMMPKLDGVEVLRSIKDKKLSARVILLTNLAHDPVMKEGKSLGALAYLIKADLTPDQLVEKVREYIKK